MNDNHERLLAYKKLHAGVLNKFEDLKQLSSADFSRRSSVSRPIQHIEFINANNAKCEGWMKPFNDPNSTFDFDEVAIGSMHQLYQTQETDHFSNNFQHASLVLCVNKRSENKPTSIYLRMGYDFPPTLIDSWSKNEIPNEILSLERTYMLTGYISQLNLLDSVVLN